LCSGGCHGKLSGIVFFSLLWVESEVSDSYRV
jgi:hypothetical protein